MDSVTKYKEDLECSELREDLTLARELRELKSSYIICKVVTARDLEKAERLKDLTQQYIKQLNELRSS